MAPSPHPPQPLAVASSLTQSDASLHSASNLSSLRSAISSAEEQVHALELQLKEAKAKRDALIFEKARLANPTGASDLPIEVIANIIRHTLAAVMETEDAHRPCETDPFQMMDLRLVCRKWNGAALETPDLWSGVQIDVDRWDPTTSWDSAAEGKRYALWEFIQAWTKRAGGDRRTMRLVVRGKCDRNTWDGHGAFANEIVREEVAAILTDRRIGWTRWHFESPVVPMLCASAQPVRGGLVDLVMEHVPLLDRVGGYGSEDWWDALGRLTHLGFWGNWPVYSLFKPYEPSRAFGNLESLFLSQSRMPLPITLGFDAHLPSNPRFLHLEGGCDYPVDTILRPRKLEELILESLIGMFKLSPSANGLVTNSTLRRLVLVGAEPILQLPTLLQFVELPSLELIRLCKVGYERGRHWDHAAEEAVTNFFARSGLTSTDLSIEDIGTRDWEFFKNVLRIFRNVCLRHLFLEDIGTILERTNLEEQDFEAIVCRTAPICEYHKPLAGSNKKRRMYLPQSEAELPSGILEAFDIKLLSSQELNRMFSHGIQGHQYLKSVDRQG